MKREVAWRVFAGEFNSSSYQYTEGGERAPAYVVTPLGARVNRLFVAGVLTDLENVATEEEPMWRARISDPTGVFFVSAGQYQPEASQAISRLQPPTFVACTGKGRLFSPEEGVSYASVRLEMVKEVDAGVRDYWILETCRSLKTRMEVMRAALEMEHPTAAELTALGYSESIAQGLAMALEHYPPPDLERYEVMLVDALRYLLPDYEGEPKEAAEVQETVDEEPKEDEEIEEKVLAVIDEVSESAEGASWEAIVEAARKAGIDKALLEEVTNRLLDKGLIYEPVLGRMRRI
jgi:RPA family protein